MKHQQAISRIQRRTVIDRAIRLSGIGAGAALAMCLVLIVLDRLAVLSSGVLWWLTAVLLGAAAGLVIAVIGRPTRAATARRLDRELRLDDRLATAIALQTPRSFHDTGFADLVRRGADDLAGRLDPRSVAPIRITAAWGIAAALGAMVAAAGAWLPHVTPEPPEDRRAAGATPADTPDPDETADSIASTLRTLRDEPGLNNLDGRADTLDELARQLDAEPDPQAARELTEQSAAELDDLADQVAEQAAEDLAAADELTERFRGVARREQADDPITEAIRSGNLDELADLLESIESQRNTLAPAEREALAEQLQQAARGLESMSEADRARIAEQMDDLRRVLREQDLPEDAADTPPPETDELADRLRDTGADEQTARELADAIRELQKRQSLNERVERDAEQLADALEQAARDLQEPPDPAPQPNQPPQRDSPADQQPGEQPTGDTSNTTPNAEEDRQQPPAQRDEQPGEQRETTQASEQRRDGAQSGDQQRDSPQEQRDDTQTGEQQRDDTRTGEQQRDDTRTGEQQRDDTQTGEQQRDDTEASEQQRDGATSGGQPQPDADRPETNQPGSEMPESLREEQDAEASPDGSEDGDATQRPVSAPDEQSRGREQLAEDEQADGPADRVRDMARRRRDAERQRAVADRIRDTARRLMEGDPPPRGADDPKLGGPGVEPGRGDGAAPRTETPARREIVDLQKNDPPADRVIAEWLRDRPIDEMPAAGGDRPQVTGAQRVAERAVDDTTVPGRYHRLIERYFRRLPQTVERAGEPADGG